MKDIMLIDKPAGWTSFDVVAKIRGTIRAEYQSRGEKATKRQLKVGHAGTLDPFATGLLVILLGDACKQAGTFLKLDKTYEFTAKLGEVSSTGDPEGEIASYELEEQGSNAHRPTSEEVEQILQQFTGEIEQTPPAYSAIKIDGKRAYKLAREGKEFTVPSRRVLIHRLELVEYKYPYLTCVCDVGSGTYIRSLVEDIGTSLKTGAYCTQLRRTRIGNFFVKDAEAKEKLQNKQQPKQKKDDS